MAKPERATYRIRVYMNSGQTIELRAYTFKAKWNTAGTGLTGIDYELCEGNLLFLSLPDVVSVLSEEE